MDRFDEIENDNDNMIRIARDIIAGGIVIGGIIFMAWYWLASV